MNDLVAKSRLAPRIACVLLVLAGVAALLIFRDSSPDPIDGEPNGEAEVVSSELAESANVDLPDIKHDGYLGSKACAECHEEISASYNSHPMANSLWQVSAAPALENFDETAFSPDGRHHYSVEKTADGFLHHERLTDDSGETLYDQSERVDYAVGSGAQGRSYLIDRSGLLFQSPISWYSEAHRWDLSPGYELPRHSRFDRRIQAECVNCHAGRINTKRGSDRRFGQSPFFELSIGCERCHGPGEEHVAYWRDLEHGDKTDPVVNPASLDASRRNDVCAQCHLKGKGRIPHKGYEVTDFRPGQRLEETCTILIEAWNPSAKHSAVPVSQVEQLRTSACFLGSGGKMGCITCHEVHPASGQPRSYRAKCLDCHQDKGCSVPVAERIQLEPQDSCVHCHMPSKAGSQIPHTAHTNHQILRKPVSPADESKPSVFSLPTAYDGAETRLPRLVIDRAQGLWLAEQAEYISDRALAARALQVLLRVNSRQPNDADVLDGLGTATAVSGRFDDSLEYWKQAITIEPYRDQTIRTAALVLHNSNQPEAAQFLKTYLELQPWDAAMWGRYSHLLGQTGKWEEATAAAEKSRKLDPSIPRIYQWLSECYHRTGDADRSQHFKELFNRIRALK